MIDVIKITNRLVARFEEKFMPVPVTGCWIWVGAQIPGGYGSFRVDGCSAPAKAHRVSWMIYRGGIPRGQQVLHHCDTPSCVNPDHLFIGNNAANVCDRVAKGRSAKMFGETNNRWTGGKSLLRGTLGVARGERVHGAKLTASDVAAIRDDRRSQRDIADEFGVSQTLISQVKLRKVWAHVD